MNLQNLQLDYPTKNRTIVQGFNDGMNTTLYLDEGLVSHSAIDFGATYGDEITSSSRGLGRIYKKLNENNPNLMKYRAVLEIIDLDDCSIELEYGHCSRTDSTIGQTVQGQHIGYVGNTGDVFANGVYVTQAQKDSGSHLGAHIHFQMRYLTRTTVYDNKRQYLSDTNGNLYIYQGQYYLIPHYSEGHNGLVDPLPYLTKVIIPSPPETPSDLTPEQGVIIQQELTVFQKFLVWLQSFLSEKSGQ